MLPAPHRLRGDANFTRLLKHGRRFFTPRMMLRIVPNDDRLSRFAFVVSTRVHKKAVHRNRIKRQMREIVRKELPNIRGGYDGLIAVKKEALALTFQELQSELVDLLSKARLLIPKK